MARHADDETQLRAFHAQGFSQRTMARLLNLSPSTVAKRLTQLGLAAPADPSPRVATQGRPTKQTAIPEPMLDDLRELVDRWRDRRAALQHTPDTSRMTKRVTFQVEQHWLDAIRRQAALDGTTMTQVVHQAL
jgi:hypothetical protein